MKFVHIYITQYAKHLALKRQICNTHTHTHTYKREKTCIVIDVAKPADRNVTQKEAEKKLSTRICVKRYNECGT
jgi:hypothetical protein